MFRNNAQATTSKNYLAIMQFIITVTKSYENSKEVICFIFLQLWIHMLCNVTYKQLVIVFSLQFTHE